MLATCRFLPDRRHAQLRKSSGITCCCQVLPAPMDYDVTLSYAWRIFD